MRKVLSKEALLLLAVLMTFVFGMGQPKTADAASNLIYEPLEVNLPGGYTEVVGIFNNLGDRDVLLESVKFNVYVTNYRGQKIWSEVGKSNLNLYMPAHTKKKYRLKIANSNAPRCSSGFKWDVVTSMIYR